MKALTSRIQFVFTFIFDADDKETFFPSTWFITER